MKRALRRLAEWVVDAIGRWANSSPALESDDIAHDRKPQYQSTRHKHALWIAKLRAKRGL